MRMLIIDDQPDSAMALAGLLRHQGYRVQTLHDSRAAMQTIKSFQPDIVLLDIVMPHMNGYVWHGKYEMTSDSNTCRLSRLAGSKPGSSRGGRHRRSNPEAIQLRRG